MCKYGICISKKCVSRDIHFVTADSAVTSKTSVHIEILLRVRIPKGGVLRYTRQHKVVPCAVLRMPFCARRDSMSIHQKCVAHDNRSPTTRVGAIASIISLIVM